MEEDESGITLKLPLRCEVKKFELDDLIQDLAQEAEPDKQRLEIEDIARVIVTPSCVEIYTFDDKIYFVEFGGTVVKKMKWVNTPEGGVELEEEIEPKRQYASKPARQFIQQIRDMYETDLPKEPFVPV